MPADVAKRLFTVDEYYRMAASDIFEYERVELVEGEVVTMAPIGSRHAACVTRFNRTFSRLLGDRFLVRVQQPVHLSELSELEPDIAVVPSRPDFYAGGHPSAPDVLLVVEVAESSLAYDRDVKLPLYARAGVAEAWLIDLAGGTVSVHTSPAADGYEQVDTRRSGESVASSALPLLDVPVTELLGEE